MTSFAVAIEPDESPRLAALALLLHLAAAASPWFARVAAPLAALAIDARGCRVRLRGQQDFLVAELGTGSRAYPWLVHVDIRAGGRRFGWLVAAGSLPPGQFRRLKARIRLSC